VRLPAAGTRPAGLAPLRRRPKQLTAAPALFHPGAGTPVVRDTPAARGDGDVAGPAGGQGVLVTGQPAALRDVGELFSGSAPDREVAVMAQRIARRLARRRRPREHRGERGAGRLASVPYRYRSDDIDLDRTIEVLTDVGFALAVARSELGRSPARHRTAVLLSDTVHNAGPDPRSVAARFSRLHVLLQTDGEHDAPLAADLARLGHGRLAPVATHRDVAPALNRLLA
jgi:hypothetical protein